MSIQDNKKYRPSVGLWIINPHNHILVGKRLDNGLWQPPQGGIEPNEIPLDTALRELEEETAIPQKNVRFLAEHEGWFCYDWETSLDRIHNGQKQKWIAFKHAGMQLPNPCEIAHTSQEFEQFAWHEPKQIAENNFNTSKAVIYASVASYFNKLIT